MGSFLESADIDDGVGDEETGLREEEIRQRLGYFERARDPLGIAPLSVSLYNRRRGGEWVVFLLAELVCETLFL